MVSAWIKPKLRLAHTKHVWKQKSVPNLIEKISIVPTNDFQIDLSIWLVGNNHVHIVNGKANVCPPKRNGNGLLADLNITNIRGAMVLSQSAEFMQILPPWVLQKQRLAEMSDVLGEAHQTSSFTKQVPGIGQPVTFTIWAAMCGNGLRIRTNRIPKKNRLILWFEEKPPTMPYAVVVGIALHWLCKPHFGEVRTIATRCQGWDFAVFEVAHTPLHLPVKTSGRNQAI
jgi:hypothetical protein